LHKNIVSRRRARSKITSFFAQKREAAGTQSVLDFFLRFKSALQSLLFKRPGVFATSRRCVIKKQSDILFPSK